MRERRHSANVKCPDQGGGLVSVEMDMFSHGSRSEGGGGRPQPSSRLKRTTPSTSRKAMPRAFDQDAGGVFFKTPTRQLQKKSVRKVKKAQLLKSRPIERRGGQQVRPMLLEARKPEQRDKGRATYWVPKFP